MASPPNYINIKSLPAGYPVRQAGNAALDSDGYLNYTHGIAVIGTGSNPNDPSFLATYPSIGLSGVSYIPNPRSPAGLPSGINNYEKAAIKNALRQLDYPVVPLANITIYRSKDYKVQITNRPSFGNFQNTQYDLFYDDSNKFFIIKNNVRYNIIISPNMYTYTFNNIDYYTILPVNIDLSGINSFNNNSNGKIIEADSGDDIGSTLTSPLTNKDTLNSVDYYYSIYNLAPAAHGPPPAAHGPPPAAHGPAPVARGPAPVARGPAPVARGPAPATGSPPPAAGPAGIQTRNRYIFATNLYIGLATSSSWPTGINYPSLNKGTVVSTLLNNAQAIDGVTNDTLTPDTTRLLPLYYDNGTSSTQPDNSDFMGESNISKANNLFVILNNRPYYLNHVDLYDASGIKQLHDFGNSYQDGNQKIYRLMNRSSGNNFNADDTNYAFVIMNNYKNNNILFPGSGGAKYGGSYVRSEVKSSNIAQDGQYIVDGLISDSLNTTIAPYLKASPPTYTDTTIIGAKFVYTPAVGHLIWKTNGKVIDTLNQNFTYIRNNYTDKSIYYSNGSKNFTTNQKIPDGINIYIKNNDGRFYKITSVGIHKFTVNGMPTNTHFNIYTAPNATINNIFTPTDLTKNISITNSVNSYDTTAPTFAGGGSKRKTRKMKK